MVTVDGKIIVDNETMPADISTIDDNIVLIEADTDAINSNIVLIEADTDVINTNVAIIKDDTALIKADISTIDDNIILIEADTDVINTNIVTIKDDTALIKADVDAMNAKMGTLAEVAASTNLNAVGAITVGADITMTAFKSITFIITATGVTTGGTMLIQGTLDGTTYVTLKSIAITANGSDVFTIVDEPYLAVRSNLSAWTDGAFTSKYIRS